MNRSMKMLIAAIALGAISVLCAVIDQKFMSKMSQPESVNIGQYRELGFPEIVPDVYYDARDKQLIFIQAEVAKANPTDQDIIANLEKLTASLRQLVLSGHGGKLTLNRSGTMGDLSVARFFYEP